MTDIVDRLDKLLNDINMYDHYRPVIRKAAREIKRQREQIVNLEEQVARLDELANVWLRDEVRRLMSGKRDD